MRILQVSNTFAPLDISGVGTLVYELAREAERRDLDVRVLTRRPAPGDAVVTATGGSKLLFPLRAAWTYLRLTRRWRPDIVHVHESDGIFLLLAARLSALWRRGPSTRFVATLQVSYVEERKAVRPVSDGERIVSRPVREELTFRRFRAPLLATFGRLSARLAHAVIAPSRVTASEIERDYGVDRVEVVYNGIAARAADGSPADADAQIDDGAEPSRTRPVVLYVGRLRTRKAVAVLLSAFARLRTDSVLRIVGGGEQSAALARLRDELGLPDRVILEGAVPRTEVGRRYSCASIFCLPSTYEGFPLAILEAMKAGLPVVSTSVSGIPEAVDDGVTGLVVPPENAAALADALDDLLESEERRCAMGAAGRLRFEERFAIGRIAVEHLDLYERLSPAVRAPGSRRED